MKKLFLFLYIFLNGCYAEYDFSNQPTNYFQYHIFEIKHYESQKIYSAESSYSKEDARYNALLDCQNDNSDEIACLDYSYTQQGNLGPINQESYWQNSKKAYLNPYDNAENDFTKITEWSSIDQLEKDNKKNTIIAKKETKKIVNKKNKLEKKIVENFDNNPPVLLIESTFTFDDPSYSIKGKVTDESDKIYVDINGKIIKSENGSFFIKRFSPVSEKLTIQATDQWGNQSEVKIINVNINLNNKITITDVEPLNPSVVSVGANANKVALIIGIEDYELTPSASYANLDAKFFYEYTRLVFGVPKLNIKLLTDNDASLIKSISAIEKWLPGKIKSGKTDLIVFFAGHGLASTDGKELYLLPQDSDPDLLERTALSRNELFKNIIDLNPKSVTMFFDTCFSGVSRDEKTLLASARPIRIVANEQESIPDNFTIFSASQLDQISSGLKNAKHGIFSYYLMKGIEGKADTNKDYKITNGELLSYLDENVSVQASSLGRQQNPSLAGDPEKVLIRY